MAFADSSSTRLSYITESAENTFPTSPTLLNLRYTSETLNYLKRTVSSEEIRADRNVSDMADVGFGVGGDVGFELSYGTFDSLIESLLYSTWSSDVIKNGVTPKTFSFEKTFETGATDQFMRFTGMKVGSMSLSIAAQQRITGSMTMMGMGHTKASAALSGATYTAAGTSPIMTASGDVGSLSITGVSPSPTIMSMSINIQNNLREQLQIGSRGPAGIGAGRFIVTGSLEAYFADLSMYNAFYDHDDVGISANLGSTSGSIYTLDMPRTKLTNGTVQTPGNDQDIMASFDFQAIYSTSGSPANNSSIILTRAVA